MPERALKCGCRSLEGTVPRVDMETLPSSPHSLLCVFTYILCDTFQSKLRNVSRYFPGFCKLFSQIIKQKKKGGGRTQMNALAAVTISKGKCEYSESLLLMVGI